MEPEAFAKLQGPSFCAYLTEYPMTLGRAKDLDGHIHLSEDPKISKTHASIDWNPVESSFFIRCIGRNSLLVNQVRLKAEDPPARLHSKTAVRIGSVEFYFLLPAQKD